HAAVGEQVKGDLEEVGHGLGSDADTAARQEHLRTALSCELLFDVQTPVDAVDTVRQVGRELTCYVDELFPRPGTVVRHRHAGLLEQVEVDEQPAGVTAGRQPVDRAVEGGRGVGCRIVIVQTNGVGYGGQVEELSCSAVLGRVGAAHGDDVGCVARRRRGGQLVEVA